MALLLLLTGCGAPCRLSLAYRSDLRDPIAIHQFQPGVKCVY
jgi:hypothetical protein